MKLGELMRDAVQRLAESGVENAQRDVQILMAEILTCDPSRLMLLRDDEVTQTQADIFAKMVAARSRRQPVSQIVGYREFWGRRFSVNGDVLDPRPDTELIIEEALKGPVPDRFLDLCTGSGNLAITLLCEWPQSRCVATDISQPALDIALKNAQAHGVEARFESVNLPWMNDLEAGFDLVVSNPPYISADEMADLSPEVRDWEPHIALTPGGDGLEAYRRFAVGLQAVLNPGGRAILEFGYKQADAVTAIFRAEGYSDTRILRDLGGNERIIVIMNKF